MPYQNVATKVLTGEVRLSYANLTTPRPSANGGASRYSVSLLIPKTDTATIENIKASISAAAEEARGKKWNGYMPPNIHGILHDGDGVKENGKPYGDECKGHYVINAASNQPPEVVHQSDIKTKLAPSDIYSGMHARVTLNFYGFARPEKIGIGCGLGNVMKTRDDEPLSGGASAESDFEGVGSMVQAQSPAAPFAYGSPPPTTLAPFTPQVQPTINPLTGLPM